MNSERRERAREKAGYYYWMNERRELRGWKENFQREIVFPFI